MILQFPGRGRYLLDLAQPLPQHLYGLAEILIRAEVPERPPDPRNEKLRSEILDLRRRLGRMKGRKTT